MNEISTWNFYLIGELCFVSNDGDRIGVENYNQKQKYFLADIIHSLISKFKFSLCNILPGRQIVVESLFKSRVLDVFV